MKWLREKVRQVVEAAVAQLFGGKRGLQAPELRALEELREHPPDLGPFIRQSVEEILHPDGSGSVPGDADDRQ